MVAFLISAPLSLAWTSIQFPHASRPYLKQGGNFLPALGALYGIRGSEYGTLLGKLIKQTNCKFFVRLHNANVVALCHGRV